MAATTDPIILRLREAFAASGLTLDELGTKMGYEGDVARKSAWQFLNKTADPRMSMIRRFAGAVGVPLAELVGEEKARLLPSITPEQEKRIAEDMQPVRKPGSVKKGKRLPPK